MGLRSPRFSGRPGEDRLEEYVREIYKSGDEIVLSLLRKHLPILKREDPDWQVAVLKGRKGVVVTERPRAIRRIWVLGLGGEEVLFRRVQD